MDLGALNLYIVLTHFLWLYQCLWICSKCVYFMIKANNNLFSTRCTTNARFWHRSAVAALTFLFRKLFSVH